MTPPGIREQAATSAPTPVMEIVDLGRMAYRPAYEEQLRRVDDVLRARERAEAGEPRTSAGHLLLVEHDAVITISKRESAKSHLLASADMLGRMGVAVEETDRGGDITYHGPGQLVAYPILDLNLLNLGLHDYMRMLEDAVIATLAHLGIDSRRDPTATGAWVPNGGVDPSGEPADAKICAMGVRVKRWISMHGLAINVATNLDHFSLIVPCGLAGRPVTSVQRLHAAAGALSKAGASMDLVKSALVAELSEQVSQAWTTARHKRDNPRLGEGVTH